MKVLAPRLQTKLCTGYNLVPRMAWYCKVPSKARVTVEGGVQKQGMSFRLPCICNLKQQNKEFDRHIDTQFIKKNLKDGEGQIC